MKKLCYLLALGSAFLWAKPYMPLEMNQLLVEKDGKHSINFSVLPQYLNHLAEYAGSYPPAVDNEADKIKVQQDISALIKMLGYINAEILKEDEELLKLQNYYVIAQLSYFGYNVDIPQSAETANKVYIYLLQAMPEHLLPPIQMQYGLFLTLMDKYPEGEKALLKAIELKHYPAYLALAENLIQQDKLNEAEKALDEYLKHFPDDESAKKRKDQLKNHKDKK